MTLVEHMSRTFVPILPLTNRGFDDAPEKIDSAGYATAAILEEQAWFSPRDCMSIEGRRFTRGIRNSGNSGKGPKPPVRAP